MNRAVFIDRDGVINKAIIKDGQAYSPRHFGEFEFMQSVADQIRKIKEAGYYVIVVTNQPDISRGNMDISELNKMTEAIKASLPVDEIFICPHDDSDNCLCRKPKPGMLLDAAKRYEIDLNKSFFIGDGWKDMGAAKNAGCMGILIGTFYNKDVDCFRRVKDMNGAIDIILNEREEC
jgi:D-glycero-D-manno-heptose 1,7-bisphosphate phosphatase